MNTNLIINLESVISRLQDQINKLSRKYKVYTAVLTQDDTDDPVVKVLENTIGNIVWTRDSQGVYYGTLTGAFKEFKTWCSILSLGNDGSSGVAEMGRLDTNNILLQFYNFDGNLTDIDTGTIYEISLEIRVYY